MGSVEGSETQLSPSIKKAKLSDHHSSDQHSEVRSGLFANADNAPLDECLPTIHMLNNETMDHILSFMTSYVDLFRLSGVCKRWYNLATIRMSRFEALVFGTLKPHLCTSFVRAVERRLGVELSHQDPSIQGAEESFLRLISVNHRVLRTLSLIGMCSFDHEKLRKIFSTRMPHLSVLELDQCAELSEEACEMMTENVIPFLRVFSFYLSSITNQQSLQKMLNSAGKVEYLSLKEPSAAKLRVGSMMHNTRARLSLNFTTIPWAANTLIACSLYGYINIHSDSLRHVLMTQSQSLEYLNISGTNLEGLNNMETDDLPVLSNLKVFLASLRHHYGEEGYDFPDFVPTPCSHQLAHMLKLMPNLRVLDLTENHHLQSKGINVVKLITEHCPLLEELHLVNCNILSEFIIDLKNLRHLKRLFLGNIYTSNSCHQIDLNYSGIHNELEIFGLMTDQILPSLPELELISLSLDNHRVRPEQFVKMFDSAGPKLRGISLSLLFQNYSDMYSIDNRLAYIKGIVSECKEKCRKREAGISLSIHGWGLVHWDSCTPQNADDCTCNKPIFDEVSPDFLTVKYLLIDSDFDYKSHYSENVSLDGRINVENEYVKLPRVSEGEF